jgi:hypothetical protein
VGLGLLVFYFLALATLAVVLGPSPMVLSIQAPKAYTSSLQTPTVTTRNLLLPYFLLMGLGLLLFYFLAVATLAVVLRPSDPRWS